MGRQKRHTGFLKQQNEHLKKRFKGQFDAENEEIKKNYNRMDKSIYELANNDKLVSSQPLLKFSIIVSVQHTLTRFTINCGGMHP